MSENPCRYQLFTPMGMANWRNGIGVLGDWGLDNIFSKGPMLNLLLLLGKFGFYKSKNVNFCRNFGCVRLKLLKFGCLKVRICQNFGFLKSNFVQFLGFQVKLCESFSSYVKFLVLKTKFVRISGLSGQN